jgi:hypothetical protein
MVAKHGGQIIESTPEARQADRGPTLRNMLVKSTCLALGATHDRLVRIFPDMTRFEISSPFRIRHRRNARESRIGNDLRWAGAIVLAGILVSNISTRELRAQDQPPIAGSPGTPPLKGTPATDDNMPAESKPGGTRPTTPAPEPARPGPEAEKHGAKMALPDAPAEKMAPPIKDK